MAKSKPKRTGSRGKYASWITGEGLLKIEGWARDGLTDEQIAHNIGISRQTLYEWIKRYPVISATLKKGKEVIDRQVENALLKRALGYKYDEITQEQDENGNLHITKVVTKEVTADTTAQIFWLKNRKPNEWRDKRQMEHSGGVDIERPLKAISTEELKKLVDKLDD